ncbi:MAG: hypothetical protein Q4C70_12270, partial [Planctomycetia bacterium]|nr:hypothetical protein [Planctomycetia bacterium]
HAETPSYTEMPTVYSLQKLQSGNLCALERCQSIFFGTIYHPIGTSLGKCGKSWLFLVITLGACIALSLITIILWKVQLSSAFANLRVLRYGKPIRVQETERHDTGRYARYQSIYRIVFRGSWEDRTPYEYVRETSETDIFDERKEHWLLVHQEDGLFFEEILKMYRITENGKFRLKFGVLVRFLLLIILGISLLFPEKTLDVLKSVSDFLYS